MKFSEFKSRIKAVYAERFPHSKCAVQVFNCCGKSICIDCYLAADSTECSNGIIGNDMFHISFMAELPDDFNQQTDDLPECMVLEALKNYFTVKSGNPHLYCDYHKIPYRKTKGNAEKMIATFRKFIDKLYDAVNAEIDADNIHENFTEIVMRKVKRKEVV